MAISDTITIDAAPGIAELNAFADAAARAEEAFARIGKGSLGGGADKLAASMAAAADRIEAASSRAAAAMGRLSSTARSATGGLDALGVSADAAGAGLDRAAAGADAAAAASGRLAKASDAGAAAMDRQAVAGKGANEGFLSKHKELLLGTAVVMGYAVDKAMKFNSTMTMLNTQANVPKQWLPELSKGVLTLAGQVGIGPNSLADSLYHVASNMASMPGVSPVKMLEATKIAAEGAAVGHSNLVDTTTALTSVLASGIPGAKNYSQAMGFINATVGSGEMHMQDLAEAMGTGVVPVVKGYGLTLKDVGASLATFGDLNIRGAKAGTDLRMSVQALSVPAKDGKAQLEAWGRSSNALAKDMEQGGLIKALDDLNHMFKAHGITAKTEGQYITDMFGKKAGAGLAILLENMDRLHSKYPVLQQDANNFGKAWQATQDTAQQKLKRVEAGAQALAITAGNVLMPYATKALGGLDTAFQWLQTHAFAQKGIALGAGTLLAGGLAKGLFSGVESGLSGLGKIGSVLKIPGADKLAGIGQGAGLNGAAGNLDASAAALKGAAADLSGAAGKESAAAAEPGKGGVGGTAGASGLAGFLGPAALGLAIGAALRAAGDTIAPKGSQSGKYSQALQQQSGQPGPAQQLHPYILGGFEGWLTSHIGQQVGGAIDNALHFVGLGGRSAPAKPAGPAASAQFTNSLAQAMGKPVKMAPPDISALTGAKGRAEADAKALQQSVDNALKKPAKAAPPDLSAYTAAVPKAHADGVALSAGFASGIESGKGAAVAAAADVAGAASAAMAAKLQTRSPSKVTHKIGEQTWQGFVLGLEGGKTAVDAAATALGRNVAKAADIASIDSTVKKLLTEVPKGDTGLTKMLRADQGKLTSLANQRARLETEITDAQQITGNVISGASIMNAATATRYDPGTAQSAAGLVGGMQAQAGNLALFARQVALLKKMGLNATSLDQIVQAGPDQGLAIAQGLTTGGRGNIGQINYLEKQIQGSAGKIGDVGGPAMYQAGADAGKAAAAGLRSQLGAVEAAMKQMAQAMVNAVRHPGSVAGGHGGGGGGGTTIIVNVAGHVMTEHELVALIQGHVLTQANNNYKGGWQLQGRGV